MWQYNYTAVDDSNYLKHYKYIRKYQKNGHTYYVYDDSEYKLNKEVANTADKLTKELGKRGWVGEDGYKHTYDKSTHSKTNTYKKRDLNDKITEATFNNAKDVRNKHYLQTFKDIPRRIHAKGLSAVSNILRRLRKD